MHIQVSEITEEGLEFPVNDFSWFPDKEVRRSDDLKAAIYFERRQDRLVASGSIELVYVLACDRCLESFEFPDEIEFSLTLEQDCGAAEKEHQCNITEMDVVFFDGTVLDVGAILEQQVLLSLPSKNLCRDDCRGLCSGCGTNLNRKTCACAGKSADSPFSVLGRLINK